MLDSIANCYHVTFIYVILIILSNVLLALPVIRVCEGRWPAGGGGDVARSSLGPGGGVLMLAVGDGRRGPATTEHVPSIGDPRLEPFCRDDLDRCVFRGDEGGGGRRCAVHRPARLLGGMYEFVLDRGGVVIDDVNDEVLMTHLARHKEHLKHNDSQLQFDLAPLLQKRMNT